MKVKTLAYQALFTTLGVLLFGLTVAMHEAGHLVAGLLFGLNVVEFSLGFGPLLAQVDALGLSWSLRAIPLGGYCMIEEEVFSSWPMFFTLGAGLLVNFVSAFVGFKVAAHRGEGAVDINTLPRWMKDLPWYYGGPVVRLLGFPFVVIYRMGQEIEEGDYFRAFAQFHLTLGVCNAIPLIPFLDGTKMMGVATSLLLGGGRHGCPGIAVLAPPGLLSGSQGSPLGSQASRACTHLGWGSRGLNFGPPARIREGKET